MPESRTATAAAAPATTHPLDPLTAGEIERASAIAAERLGARASLRFPLVAALDPPKGAAAARLAELVCFDAETGRTTEVVVDLDAGAVESATERPGVQPYALREEYERAEAAIRADAGWRAAMAARGASEREIETAFLHLWPVGNFGSKWEREHRILKGLSYLRESPDDDGYYGRPVEGLVAIVDLIAGRVLELEDHPNPRPPRAAMRFDHDCAGPERSGLQPLEIVQAEGPSFELEGHLLRWQKWQMRVSLHPREGLVLHEIGYEDGGRTRRICDRASVAEMVVPYGDPTAGQYFKNAFDSGECGLGRMTNSLELGCDCLGEIRYMDGAITDERGGAITIANAICIHEEDHGILWKHTYRDEETGEPRSWMRRSRRLTVSSIATVDNYDYGFYWHFYQDGSWEHEVKATGIVQTMAVPEDEPELTRHKIAPGLAGAIHQHFLTFRLDMAVDGGPNTVYEVDAAPLPRGEGNPHGNAFTARATAIADESESGREVNPASARHWRIANDSERNPLGEATAYALIPGMTVAMMADADSAAARRAAFARKQLWVTAHEASERYPGGDYPAQSEPGEGMPKWTAQGRPLRDADVVLWYTVGMNHVARPEDWPVMPVQRAGFRMRPWGFFDRNPGLDVPMPEHCAD